MEDRIVRLEKSRIFGVMAIGSDEKILVPFPPHKRDELKPNDVVRLRLHKQYGDTRMWMCEIVEVCKDTKRINLYWPTMKSLKGK